MVLYLFLFLWRIDPRGLSINVNSFGAAVLHPIIACDRHVGICLLFCIVGGLIQANLFNRGWIAHISDGHVTACSFAE